jgi:hypothetical protein
VVRGATAKSADVSRNGTLVTHDAGLEQQPSPQSRRALWLCNACSHQWPTTYSGTKTDTTSRELFRRRLAMCLITGRVTSPEGMSCHRLERVGFSPPAPATANPIHPTSMPKELLAFVSWRPSTHGVAGGCPRTSLSANSRRRTCREFSCGPKERCWHLAPRPAHGAGDLWVDPFGPFEAATWAQHLRMGNRLRAVDVGRERTLGRAELGGMRALEDIIP